MLSKKTNNTELRLQRRPIAEYLLFNLETDPGERTNVIADHKVVADRMKSRLQQLIDAGRSRP